MEETRKCEEATRNERNRERERERERLGQMRSD
jgi:hypothetical protein